MVGVYLLVDDCFTGLMICGVYDMLFIDIVYDFFVITLLLMGWVGLVCLCFAWFCLGIYGIRGGLVILRFSWRFGSG